MAGLYDRMVLPRLLALAMRAPRLVPLRARIGVAAEGVVLDLGIGSGLNLPFYGPAVHGVIGIDPSGPLRRLAGARAAALGVALDLREGTAERLPVESAGVDTVVSTWTLCSVADPAAALAEVRRVLRPGGRLLFAEHGLAPDPGVARWQHRLTPGWRRIAGGCHLDRPMDALIRDAGFAIAELHTGYMEGPRPMTFMYEGSAAPEC